MCINSIYYFIRDFVLSEMNAVRRSGFFITNGQFTLGMENV